MKRLLLAALIPGLLAACSTATPVASSTDDDQRAGVHGSRGSDGRRIRRCRRPRRRLAGAWRDPKNTARDMYRHPRETLAFFGVGADETVIEITPGGGWYAEILAPYLRDAGHYVAAVWDDAIPGQPGYRYRLNKDTAREVRRQRRGVSARRTCACSIRRRRCSAGGIGRQSC